MKLKLLSAILAHTQLVASYGDYSSTFEVNNNQWSETISRDVCIVGGGAGGVNAAVTLIDQNRTVVLLDRNDFLGGHTHTYIDPATQATVDIGVVIYQPLSVVTDFFAKFNVPLLNISSVEPNQPGQPANKSLPSIMYRTIQTNADFRDGSKVTPAVVPGQAEALQTLIKVLSQYSYLLEGFDLPDPVPEDLYMPFGAFLEKYNATAAFGTWYAYAQGMGDLLQVSTIYAVKYYNLGDLTYASTGYYTQAQGNLSELYTRAGSYIGASNVLLESYVVAANRKNMTSGRPELLVATRDAGLKLLSCEQILLTIPPTLTNLRGWDLTPEEHAVFSQFTTANGYWTGLVKNIGLNQSISIINSAPRTPFNIPVLPALYQLGAVGVIDDVWNIKFAADNPTMTDAQVKSYVERQIATLQKANNVTVTKPEWLIFESHKPFQLQVSREAIKGGFFKQLGALQGGLGGTMFYSGATFHVPYSTYLWRFNRDVVIPMMMKAVKGR